MNINNKDSNISSPVEPQSFENNSKEASDVSVANEKNNPHSNDRIEQSNFQPNSYKNDEKEHKMRQFIKELRLDDDFEEDKYFDEEGGDGYFDEDDDERFIKKESIGSALEETSGQISQDIMADLDEYSKDLDGINPNTNNTRCLSNEHGGLEVEAHDGKSEEDVWDDRSEELDQIADDEHDRLSGSSTSSLRKSFLHRKKQDRRRLKKRQEEIEEEMDEAEGGLSLLEARSDGKSSHADRVTSQRSDGSRGGGGGIQMF